MNEILESYTYESVVSFDRPMSNFGSVDGNQQEDVYGKA